MSCLNVPTAAHEAKMPTLFMTQVDVQLLLLELLELLELLDLLLQRRDWIAGARRRRRVLHQLLLHFKKN